MLSRILAILLCSNLLAGSLVDLHEVAKLPYMVAHYQKHKDNSTAFSFADFVNLHYGSKAGSHDKEEHEQHKGLPFKNHNCTYSHIVTLVVFESGMTVVPGTKISYSNLYRSAFSSSFSESIWQPPRLS